MTKIYEDAKDLHVRVVVVYQGSGNDATKAYVDPECSVRIKPDELKDAFLKGMVVKTNAGRYAKPFGMTDDESLGTGVAFFAEVSSSPAFSAIFAANE